MLAIHCIPRTGELVALAKRELQQTDTFIVIQSQYLLHNLKLQYNHNTYNKYNYSKYNYCSYWRFIQKQ